MCNIYLLLFFFWEVLSSNLKEQVERKNPFDLSPMSVWERKRKTLPQVNKTWTVNGQTFWSGQSDCPQCQE